MNIKDGIIQDCKLYGDFFVVRPIEELEKLLTGERYNKAHIQSLLLDVNISEYIYILLKMRSSNSCFFSYSSEVVI